MTRLHLVSNVQQKLYIFSKLIKVHLIWDDFFPKMVIELWTTIRGPSCLPARPAPTFESVYSDNPTNVYRYIRIYTSLWKDSLLVNCDLRINYSLLWSASSSIHAYIYIYINLHIHFDQPFCTADIFCAQLRSTNKSIFGASADLVFWPNWNWVWTAIVILRSILFNWSLDTYSWSTCSWLVSSKSARKCHYPDSSNVSCQSR